MQSPSDHWASAYRQQWRQQQWSRECAEDLTAWLKTISRDPDSMVVPQKAPDGLIVRYRGGFKDRPVKSVFSYDAYRLRADVNALVIWYGKQNAWGSYQWKVVRSEPWTRLAAINFASSQASRANIPALALFGTLGLAARREPGTMIAVSYQDGDVFFTTSVATENLRIQFLRFCGLQPEAGPKIYFDGAPLASPVNSSASKAPVGPRADSTRESQADEALNQIRTLAEMHEAGALTDEEFNSKKVELLARI